MKRYKLLPLILLSVSLLTFNCQKEGPQGPAGPAGPVGATGPVGPAGPVGTANVIYSPWVLSGSANWVTNVFTVSGSQDARFMYNRAAAAISSTIMNQGIVLCYMRNTGGALGFGINAVLQLPYTYISGSVVDHYDYIIPASGGQIYFLYKNTISPLTTSALGFIEYRYIVVPGGVSGGKIKDPRSMSYREICRVYGIPE